MTRILRTLAVIEVRLILAAIAHGPVEDLPEPAPVTALPITSLAA